MKSKMTLTISVIIILLLIGIFSGALSGLVGVGTLRNERAVAVTVSRRSSRVPETSIQGTANSLRTTRKRSVIQARCCSPSLNPSSSKGTPVGDVNTYNDGRACVARSIEGEWTLPM